MIKRENKKIVVAAKAELMSEHYYRRLWIAVRNVRIPRRAWLDEIADTFRDFNGIIIYRSGEIFPMPFVDDVFADDLDMRWLSGYLKPDQSGYHPLIISRKLERVQLIDLYFRIKKPDIARHFGR